MFQFSCGTARDFDILRAMSEALGLHQTLLQTLDETKRKNPRFSGRAFAKKLGVSPGALSEILKGTRAITPKVANRICEKLLLDPMEKAILLKPYQDKKRPLLSKTSTNAYIKLSLDEYKLTSEWYHFAILSLMKTADFKPDPEWIASRLGLSKKIIEESVMRLSRLGLLKIESNGSWLRGELGHRTSDDITNTSLQKSHFENLDLAEKALEDLPIQERDFSSLTLPFDFDQLSEAKRMIREFQNAFADRFMKERKAKDVFKLNIQLFPLTKKESD